MAGASIRPDMMTETDLYKRLDDLGVKTETAEHAAVFTVEEAKAARGSLSGAHSKNLFLKDKKKQFWLVVCLEDRPIDMKQLRHKIGAGNLSFGKPDVLLDILGVEPGSVTPFALINDTDNAVRVVLDKEMMAAEHLNFHPLTNTKTTQVTPEGLLRFIESCGHAPDIVDL
jgi:Ala-tRNA(Pro) deacylase